MGYTYGTHSSGQIALSRSSSRQLSLNVLVGQTEALKSSKHDRDSSKLAFFMKSACNQVRAHRRHAVDDGTDRSAVGFAIGVNTVEVTESGHDCEAYVCMERG